MYTEGKGLVFARKATSPPGICILIENGIPCNGKAVVRGLCGRHYYRFRQLGRLEEFAKPRLHRRVKYEVNPHATPGICRIIEDGVPCSLLANSRGLCQRHIVNIRNRTHDLRLSDFVLDRKQVTYFRQKRPRKGVCAVREVWPNGLRVSCSEKVYLRGLCGKHYRLLKSCPQMLDKVGDPSQRVKYDLRLKKNLRDGICVIQENGVGCTATATSRRRVCRRHLNALTEHGLLRELTDRFIPSVTTIARKSPDQMAEGYCIMQVNGVPCMSAPNHRGVCFRCKRHIIRLGLDFEALALPPQVQTRRVLERKPRMVQGECIALVDSVPCKKAATARGLCDMHYTMAKNYDMLEQMLLTPAEAGRLPDIPHYYLDKNVLINYAFAELFGNKGEDSSVALVKAVMDGKVRGTVSLDCIRAVYSRVGHRFARPVEDGGKGMEPIRAEAAAREYPGKLFFGRPGAWNFLAYTEEHMKACLADGILPELSLEDALEVNLFGRGRREMDIDMFVTADAQVLHSSHGVHPASVVKTGLDAHAQAHT